MRKYLIVLLLLSACGKTDPQTQTGPDTVLDGFSVKFVPATGSLLVTGMLRATQNSGTSISGEGEFFYLTGRVPGGGPLKSVVGEQSALPTCQNQECTKLTLPIKLSRLSLAEPVAITIRVPRGIQASRTRGAPSATAFADVWKELLQHGVDPAHSSVALAEWRRERFLSAYAEANGSSKTRWLLASAKEGDEKLATSYVYEVTEGPVFTLSTETGKLEASSDQEWQLGYPGGKLVFKLNP